MIYAGRPTSRTTQHVDSEVLAAMAERSGHHVEFSPHAAYLTIGRTTFMAALPPVSA